MPVGKTKLEKEILKNRFFCIIHNAEEKESDPELDPKPDPDLQRSGSGDPDPHQNVTDPQHCS